jgi:hypothetical protein
MAMIRKILYYVGEKRRDLFYKLILTIFAANAIEYLYVLDKR